MKKSNYFLGLVLPFLLFTSCAYNKAPFQDYPVQTEVQLNQANFRVVGTVFGYSRQVYVFGIGGLSRKSLKENAIMDMYENANLTGSQAIVNVTTAFTVSTVLGIYSSQRAVSRGTIIEFLQENGEPIKSVESPYNTAPQRVVKVEEPEIKSVSVTSMDNPSNTITLSREEISSNKANTYYLAWIFKTNKFEMDNYKELTQLVDINEIQKTASQYMASELALLGEGHDTSLERFALSTENQSQVQSEPSIDALMSKYSAKHKDDNREDLYYIALLMKTGQLNESLMRELGVIFDLQLIKRLASDITIKYLQKNCKGYDKDLEAFSK